MVSVNIFYVYLAVFTCSNKAVTFSRNAHMGSYDSYSDEISSLPQLRSFQKEINSLPLKYESEMKDYQNADKKNYNYNNYEIPKKKISLFSRNLTTQYTYKSSKVRNNLISFPTERYKKISGGYDFAKRYRGYNGATKHDENKSKGRNNRYIDQKISRSPSSKFSFNKYYFSPKNTSNVNVSNTRNINNKHWHQDDYNPSSEHNFDRTEKRGYYKYSDKVNNNNHNKLDQVSPFTIRYSKAQHNIKKDPNIRSSEFRLPTENNYENRNKKHQSKYNSSSAETKEKIGHYHNPDKKNNNNHKKLSQLSELTIRHPDTQYNNKKKLDFRNNKFKLPTEKPSSGYNLEIYYIRYNGVGKNNVSQAEEGERQHASRERYIHMGYPSSEYNFKTDYFRYNNMSKNSATKPVTKNFGFSVHNPIDKFNSEGKNIISYNGNSGKININKHKKSRKNKEVMRENDRNDFGLRIDTVKVKDYKSEDRNNKKSDFEKHKKPGSEYNSDKNLLKIEDSKISVDKFTNDYNEHSGDEIYDSNSEQSFNRNDSEHKSDENIEINKSQNRSNKDSTIYKIKATTKLKTRDLIQPSENVSLLHKDKLINLKGKTHLEVYDAISNKIIHTVQQKPVEPYQEISKLAGERDSIEEDNQKYIQNRFQVTDSLSRDEIFSSKILSNDRISSNKYKHKSTRGYSTMYVSRSNGLRKPYDKCKDLYSKISMLQPTIEMNDNISATFQLRFPEPYKDCTIELPTGENQDKNIKSYKGVTQIEIKSDFPLQNLSMFDDVLQLPGNYGINLNQAVFKNKQASFGPPNFTLTGLNMNQYHDKIKDIKKPVENMKGTRSQSKSVSKSVHGEYGEKNVSREDSSIVEIGFTNGSIEMDIEPMYEDENMFRDFSSKDKSQYTQETHGPDRPVLRHNKWISCLGKKVIKTCRKACKRAFRTVCFRLACTSRAKRDLKKECSRNCKKVFKRDSTTSVSSDYSTDVFSSDSYY